MAAAAAKCTPRSRLPVFDINITEQLLVTESVFYGKEHRLLPNGLEGRHGVSRTGKTRIEQFGNGYCARVFLDLLICRIFSPRNGHPDMERPRLAGIIEIDFFVFSGGGNRVEIY